MYGVNKVAGELLCDYYHQKFGVDTRGVRFGLNFLRSSSGGGTTDYAVEIYYEAIKRHIHLIHCRRNIHGYDVYARRFTSNHFINGS